MNSKVIKKYVETIDELTTQVDELQKMDSPSYRGKAAVVRGGLAMTDERLGKMRIMMRNIVKNEGADTLADELKSALSASEIKQLKNML